MSVGNSAEHHPSGSRRISKVLFDEPDHSFLSFAAFESNIRAVDAAMLFANGLNPFVAISGPSGWGKTHLLEAAAAKIERHSGVAPKCFSTVEWVGQAGRVEVPGPLLLDNVQDALTGVRMRPMLRLALERRVRAGRPTLLAITGQRPNRQIKLFLPNPRRWVAAHIQSPDAHEKILAIDQIGRVEGLHLSNAILRVLAERIGGDGRTYSGIVTRLKVDGTEWMSDERVLKALGLCDPFFSDSPDWDLCEHLSRVSDKALLPKKCRSARDMAIYALRKVAELPETKVASYYEVTQGEVFHAVGRFSEVLKADPEAAPVFQKFVETAVRCL